MYVNERRVTVRNRNKALANPRLVTIPAQSVVALKGTSYVLGFAETHLGTPESR
jgi:hypothetical protein